MIFWGGSGHLRHISQTALLIAASDIECCFLALSIDRVCCCEQVLREEEELGIGSCGYLISSG